MSAWAIVFCSLLIPISDSSGASLNATEVRWSRVGVVSESNVALPLVSLRQAEQSAVADEVVRAEALRSVILANLEAGRYTPTAVTKKTLDALEAEVRDRDIYALVLLLGDGERNVQIAAREILERIGEPALEALDEAAKSDASTTPYSKGSLARRTAEEIRVNLREKERP